MAITFEAFKKAPAKFFSEARHRPVAIGRRKGARRFLISGMLFEALLKGQSARKLEDLDESFVKAIAAGRMSSDHDHFDDPLEDWSQKVVRPKER